MLLSIHNRRLFRGMLAAGVALGGASACSRSDRADAGRDTTQVGAAVAPSDTQPSAATQPATTDTGKAPVRDTSVTTQTATPSPEPKPSRAAAAPAQDTAVQTSQQDVSGYQAMGHDTSASATSDTAIAATGDSMPADHAMADTAAAEAGTDTTAAGYEPMARDTSTLLAQGDTTSQAQIDTTAQAEADTAAIQVQVDTTTEAQTELAAEDQSDTVTVVGDSSSVDKPGPRAKEDTVSHKADSLAKYHEADPVRPPEDSTELLGQVTTDPANSDVEAVGDADADAVGAAPVQSTGNIVTGAEAVALMTREGQPCRVESSSDARWDMASSPATLNPCGTGTMTLPKVQTGEEK